MVVACDMEIRCMEGKCISITTVKLLETLHTIKSIISSGGGGKTGGPEAPPQDNACKKDQDTLIEQSATIIEKSITLIEQLLNISFKDCTYYFSNIVIIQNKRF